MFPSRWRGSGVEEEGVDTKSGKVVVKVDPRYFRPAEVEYVFPPLSPFLPSSLSVSIELTNDFRVHQSPARQPRQGRTRARLETAGRL